MRGKVLEIACFNLESAFIAQSSGANRIELCENYATGGLTPNRDLILQTREKIQIPIHVIIRPKGGGFVYSGQELEEMEESIAFCKAHKIEGVVLGVLTHDNEINLPVCQKLIEAARPMSVTFHRAVDSCKNLEAAFGDLINLAADRVLTSGGKKNVTEGISELKKLQKSLGKKIVIMPGGGLRSFNIKEVLETGCHEYHSSAITGGVDLADRSEIEGLRLFL